MKNGTGLGRNSENTKLSQGTGGCGGPWHIKRRKTFAISSFLL